MRITELQENVEAIELFKNLLDNNKEALSKSLTVDTWIPFSANAAQLERGIATLKNYHKNASLLETRMPLGGIAIFSSYNDPYFGTLGMSMVAALLVNGVKRQIVMKFPTALEQTSILLDNIIQGSGDFPNVSISSLEGKEFMDYYFSDENTGVIQVYGGPWVRKYTDHPKKFGKALRFEGPGNNPAIVHASANLEEAADRIIHMAYILSGQACVVTKRVIVDDAIDRNKFDALLENSVSSLKVGENPFEEVYVSSLKNSGVIKRLNEQINEALEGQVKTYNLNRKDAIIEGIKGMFMTPTIFYDPDTSLRIFNEESFAPVMTVNYAKESDLVKIANSTPYRLTASVFGVEKTVQPLIKELKKSHGMVMLNNTSNEMVTCNEGYIGPWGGKGVSSFYIGPDNDWKLTQDEAHLAQNFTKRI